MSTKTTAPDGWKPPSTAPRDGYDFEYLCSDGKVRIGVLAERIHRDPRMIGWRRLENQHEQS